MEHTEPDDGGRDINIGLLLIIGTSNLLYLIIGIMIGLKLADC
jgi:hypothetical protein